MPENTEKAYVQMAFMEPSSSYLFLHFSLILESSFMLFFIIELFLIISGNSHILGV